MPQKEPYSVTKKGLHITLAFLFIIIGELHMHLMSFEPKTLPYIPLLWNEENSFEL